MKLPSSGFPELGLILGQRGVKRHQRIPISFPLSSQISALAEIIAVVLGALHVVETGGRDYSGRNCKCKCQRPSAVALALGLI
jgi:hypothetical protein